jgi:hypothetical protein
MKFHIRNENKNFCLIPLDIGGIDAKQEPHSMENACLFFAPFGNWDHINVFLGDKGLRYGPGDGGGSGRACPSILWSCF